MTPTGVSRRGFLMLPGAAALTAAAVYGTRQASRASRAGRHPGGPGFEPYVDRDGWMLDPADRLRTSGDQEDREP